jgi:hypothetical protein
MVIQIDDKERKKGESFPIPLTFPSSEIKASKFFLKPHFSPPSLPWPWPPMPASQRYIIIQRITKKKPSNWPPTILMNALFYIVK